MKLEKGVGFKNVFSDFRRDVHSKNVSSGLVAGVFGLSVGLVKISAGTAAGLSPELIMMWLTSFVFINGLFGVLLASYYRLPLSMANSIPGILLFTAAIPVVGLGPTLGATFIAGLITLIVGLTGFMGKVMHYTPTPIIMGMIAGVLLSFGLDMFRPLESAFIPALLMIGAYLVLTRMAPKFPAVLGSLIVGIVYLVATGVDVAGIEFSVQYPTFVMPEFTLEAFFTFGLPLAIILVGMETPVGVSLLKSVGYKTIPINSATSVTGIATMVSSFFHMHSTCMAAPMTAICSSNESGSRDTRWVAAVIVGLIFVGVSPIYGAIVGLMSGLPGFFIAIIAGLPLLTVLVSTLTQAFDHKHRIGAIFAFLIAASDITIFAIGSPLWALVFGIIASITVEPKDFNFSNRQKVNNAA